MNIEDEKELENKKILNNEDDEYDDDDDDEYDEDEEENNEEVKNNNKLKDNKKLFDFKNKNHRIGALVALGVFAAGGFYYVKNKNNHVNYEPEETSNVVNNSNSNVNKPLIQKDNKDINEINENKTLNENSSKSNNNVELLDTDNINESLNKVNIDTKDLPKLKKPSDNIQNNYEERIKTLEDKLTSIEENSNKVEKLSKRVSELEKKVELIEKTDSLIQDIVNERKEMDKNKEEQAIKEKIEKEGNVNIDVPNFSTGKSRLIGFKILPISNDSNIILLSDINNNIIAVSKDTGFNYKGKVLKIEEVSSDGKIINFEGNLFIDTTLGFGGTKNKNIKINDNKVEIKNTIKKEKQKPNFQELNNIRGVAITKDSNDGEYTVTVEDKNNNSEMTSLKEGEYFKNYGKVKKIDDSGNVFFSKGKINFSK